MRGPSIKWRGSQAWQRWEASIPSRLDPKGPGPAQGNRGSWLAPCQGCDEKAPHLRAEDPYACPLLAVAARGGAQPPHARAVPTLPSAAAHPAALPSSRPRNAKYIDFIRAGIFEALRQRAAPRAVARGANGIPAEFRKGAVGAGATVQGDALIRVKAIGNMPPMHRMPAG